jgi:hypothetical protein
MNESATMTTTTGSQFSGFEHGAAQILKFLQTQKTFTLVLSEGKIVHYRMEDDMHFRNWLINNHIEDMRESFYKNYSALVFPSA